ncbi:MAG: response regulator [Archangiaceae bacterium]|nr:response regulator [Archangiaceae bacterium]
MSAPVAPKVPGRILVIDDDRSARMLLERVLTRAGHSVSLVDTAEEGLVRLKAEPFDLLVTDKNLPGIDGLEVLKQARSVRPNLRALLITGFPTPETQLAANDLGVHAYVTKPFGVHDILDICEAAIRASRGAAA